MFKFRLKFKNKMNKRNDSLAYTDKRTPMWKPLLFLLPAMGILILFTIIPFISTIGYSLNPLKNSHQASSWGFGLDAFRQVLGDAYFSKALVNSMLYALLAIPLSVTFSLLISAAVSSLLKKALQGLFQTLFFLPYVTSGVAVSLSFAYLFDANTGLINQLFGGHKQWLTDPNDSSFSAFFVMLIRGIWGTLAFQVLIFTTAMMSVDKDRYKAASIDGAGPIKQFFSITLPSIKRTLNFIITVGLIGAIKVFPLALFDMKPAKAQSYGGMTLMLYVFKNVAEGHYHMAAASAIILVLIAISFSIVVKNSTKAAGWLVMKGGEWRVQKKITATKQMK